MAVAATILGSDAGVASETPRAGGRVDFLGVPLDALTMAQTLTRVRGAMAGGAPIRHVCLNVAKFVHLRSDPELRADVANSDLVSADGMGIVFGGRLLGLPISERVAGVDLMTRTLALCAAEGFRPYILGAKPAVLARALAVLAERHPDLVVAGARDGYFRPEDEPGIVAAIRDAAPDCLFVALPTPAKERFLAAHARELGVPFVMGVGGSVDVIAGFVDRAPLWMQRAGLEWLHRTLREPKRMWRRYATTNTAFAGIMARELTRQAIARGARHARLSFERSPDAQVG